MGLGEEFVQRFRQEDIAHPALDIPHTNARILFSSVSHEPLVGLLTPHDVEFGLAKALISVLYVCESDVVNNSPLLLFPFDVSLFPLVSLLCFPIFSFFPSSYVLLIHASFAALRPSLLVPILRLLL
jgi:hypothetical protein